MRRKIIAAVLIVGILLGAVGIYSRCFAYIIHYNMGNTNYRQYSYDKAIRQYEKALAQRVPEGKECPIRINLALAMLGTLGADFMEPGQVNDSILVLEEAREQLLTDNCATEKETGHSPEAEQLKKEIDAILEQLYEKKEENGGEGDEPSEPEETKPAETDAKEQSVREELAKMQEKAYQDRETDRQFMKEYDLETIFEYEGDIW